MTKNNMMTVVVPKATSSSNVGEQCQHKSSATLTTNDVKDIKEGQSVVDEILSKIKPSSFGQKRLYSSINISADKWLLTLDENSIAKLENPPSLADGVDRKTELDLRYLGCEIIQSGAILLRIPQVAAATAQILYQRFYYQRSFVRHHFEYTVMACLLLASKIEEAPRRPRDVINVFHRLEHLHGKRNESKKAGRAETRMAVKMRVLPLSCTVTTSIHSAEMNEAHLELSSSWISPFTYSLRVISKTFKQYGVDTYAHICDALNVCVKRAVHWDQGCNEQLLCLPDQVIFSKPRYVPMLLDRNYVDLKNQIIKAERKLLNALGFVVHVNHPHKLIYAYLHALGATGNHELMQKAWSYMNDGLRTDIFLRYRPETIACACIHLAARTIAEPIPLPREPFPWFEAFDASDRDVQTISLLLLQVYTRIRAPNWTRLNDMLNKLRIGLSNSFAKAQHGESLAHKEVERAKAVLEKKRREIASKTAELERRQNGAGQSSTKEVIAKEKEVHRIREKENDRYNVKQSSSSLSRSRSKSPTVPKKFRSSPSYHHRSGSLERERPQKPNHHRSRQRDERRRAREERRAEKERRHRTRSRGDRRKDKVSSQREREKDVYMALGKRRRSNESPSPAKVRR